jgi:hypothetical protein
VLQRPETLAVLSTVCFLYAFLQILLRPSATPSYRLFAFYLLRMAFDTILLFLAPFRAVTLASLLLEAALVGLLFSLPISKVYPASAGKQRDTLREGSTVNGKWTSPEDNAGSVGHF